MTSSAAPVAAQYVVTFLKPEMLHIFRQLRALRTFRPVVFCQRREGEREFPFEEVRVLPKPRTHPLRRFVQKQVLRRPIMAYRSEARRLLGAVHESRAELLHIFFGHMGVYWLPLLEMADLPVVVSFHGADAQVDLEKPAHRAATQRMLALADCILARSQSLADRLLAMGAPVGKVHLHRTGLPLDNTPPPARNPPADGAWRCVQACRLIPKKGLPTTLRAFAIFAAEWPRATLEIAGEGWLLPQLQALAAELGLSNRVTFHDFLPQDRLRALFGEAHFFLHPSETGPDGDQEGVPNSLLEAMAAGLPIVATRHGGIPEAVEDQVSGRLAAEGDFQALGRALRELASAPDQWSAMSAAAAASVRARFDIQQQTRILEGLYRATIEARSAARR